MPLTNCSNSPTPVVSAGQGPCLLFNRDIANTIIYGPDSGISGGTSANLNEYSILDPLGYVALDGKSDVYASTLAQGVTAYLDVIPGASSANAGPALSAESIAALGLATEANQVTNNDYLGGTIPGALISTSSTYIAEDILNHGAPPWVQNLQSASAIELSPGSSPYTLFTATSDCRIWGGNLSFSCSTSSAYSASEQAYCTMTIGSNVSLACEQALNGPSQVAQSDPSLGMLGIALAASDSVVISINGGTTISDVFIRAAAAILYTVP
jgi:hypothetical protein